MLSLLCVLGCKREVGREWGDEADTETDGQRNAASIQQENQTLHHVAGSLYAEEHEAYEAERHLTLGTKDSPEILAKLEYEWYTQDDSHTAAIYVLPGPVFPYLLVGNVRDATKSLRLFTSRLTEENKGLSVQDISSGSSDIRIYPSLPLLNFLGYYYWLCRREVQIFSDS